jgi:nucleoside-diphosphate-sugar epimerase
LDDIGREALSNASHIVTMIPPISDFNKDPVLDLHRHDILNNVHSISECTNSLDNPVERYDGINDDIYEDDINGYEDRVLQNRLDEGIDVANDVVRSNSGLWVGYVSTTGVYGDHSGNWVTEQSETLAPTTSNAFHRINAENEWLALRSDRSSPIDVEDECSLRTVYPHVFRLGGIYGPGRSALDTVKRKNRDNKSLPSERTETVEESQGSPASGGTNWVSRIHVADICGAIIASMMAPVTGSKGEGKGSVYNVADNLPAPREVVMKYAENLLFQESRGEKGVAGGSVVFTETPSLLPKSESESSSRAVSGGEKMTSERTRRRLTENKRVSNAHIVESLGYVFKYPSYKEGLQALLGGSNDPFE